MNKLIGRYKLISHGVYNSENIFQKTSDYLKGELIYSSEKYMSVQILFKKEIEGPRDILAYSGIYKIVNESVVEHHIEVCSQFKRDKTVETRTYRIEGELLFLSIKYEDNSLFEAKWEKLKSYE